MYRVSSGSLTLRWYAKKAARAGVAIGSWISGALHHRRSLRPRVLTYHRFGDDVRDPFCVDRTTFARQMETLAEAGCAVSVADLERHLYSGRPLPAGAVLVTIDDGYRSTYTEALPILRDLGIPGVAYIPAGCMDGAGSCHAAAALAPEPRIGWDEAIELAEAGIDIGSHAWSHESLGAMDDDTIRAELERSRALLQKRTGASVTSFAYPFGTRADYDSRSRLLLGECGYRTAFTSQHGALAPGSDPLELPRVKVEGGEPLWLFRLVVRGGLDAWSLVDRTLWRLQANRNPEAVAA